MLRRIRRTQIDDLRKYHRDPERRIKQLPNHEMPDKGAENINSPNKGGDILPVNKSWTVSRTTKSMPEKDKKHRRATVY